MNPIYKKKTKIEFFKKGDLIIYLLLITTFSLIGMEILKLKDKVASNVEIYVNNELKYVYPLRDEEKKYFIPTDIGGVDIEIKDKKVRVTTSNSPLKLNIKQGWKGSAGDTIIGIPDKLLIKVIGEKKEEQDDVDLILH